MKLTFTTSLLLLTTAAATSTTGGGLRNRRLSLFAEDSAKKGAKSDKDDNKDEGSAPPANPKNVGGKSQKEDKEKGGKTGNVPGGAKSAKAASANMKMEAARPYSGIDTEDLFYFGEEITGSIELNEDYLSVDAREHFNATHVEEYTIALYPFMGRPNCDGEDPISSVPIVVTEGGTADPIDYEASFSITTDIAWRSVGGQGFDLFLLDESGCNVIMGPEAVTITLSPEEQQAEDAAAEEKSKKARTSRAKAEKAKTATVKTYKKKKEKVDQSKVTIKGKEALAADDYELSTDKEYYDVDENIVVTYSITAPAAAVAEGRRLKKRNNTPEPTEEEPEPELQPQVEDLVVSESAIQSTPEPEFDVQPDPVNPALEEDDEEEEGPQQPDLLPSDVAFEEETQCDPTDITLYKIGVFMKMANPQKGKLLPLHEVPLCSSESCTADEVSAGTITISALDLDTSRYGFGFDLWVLDCSGDGIAGPKFVSIDAE